MSLEYTGENLVLRRYITGPNEPPNTDPTVTEGYLTLTQFAGETPPPPLNFHAGFLEKLNQPDNKHFLLANLITTDDKWVNVKVANDCSSHPNNRFRNVEPEENFDTTFSCEFSIDMLFPPGEGYLYQVAPVVKYGGKLIYPETISSTTTLLDEMIIKNGATLIVNSTYNADRNIRIKEGGRITTTNGGTIKFYEGSKLIVEGTATISGTAQNKLVLDFLSPSDSNGIVIKPGGSLTISNCEIKNAGTGIFSELNADSLIVEYVDFIDCEDNSIRIAGRNGEEDTTPIKINNCTIENSVYGISVYNTSSILIRWNEITDTDCGIYLSSVPDALIVCNSIESSNEELPGILSLSSGGIIYGNTINGFTSAIQLGNSSPKIGVNTITGNKYHGIYVGAGSNPHMKGEYIGNPAIPYGLSGYNEIFENGGYQETDGPPDNDGSEIYFYNSNAVLDSGCNIIKDDRQVSPPLINTLLLMSRTGIGFSITINARNNIWGDTVYSARFSGVNVNYIPYRTEPCAIPGGGGEDELVLMTQFGDVIDTVYSTGEEVTGLSATELAYAEAERYFLTGNLTNALQVYEGIINSSATEEEK